jgi:hypothetical protein
MDAEGSFALEVLIDRNIPQRNLGPRRLHLGCGEARLSDFINIDYPSDHHNVMSVTPDIAIDLRKLTCRPGSVDEIRLHHVFEHFSRVTAISMLLRWHIWLKEGGVLVIETPDFIGTARTILTSKDWQIVMGGIRHLTGDQAAPWAYHVEQWFPERFQHTLSKLGFQVRDIKTSQWEHPPYLSNVTVTAIKASSIEVSELLQRADDLLWESTVSSEEHQTLAVWKDQLREMLLQVDIL